MKKLILLLILLFSACDQGVRSISTDGMTGPLEGCILARFYDIRWNNALHCALS